jgi:uncharacterized protein YjbI with pentapeptide repeats
MRWWSVTTAVVLIVVSGGLLAMWLLGVWAPIPQRVSNPEQLRLDRIKTGLTVAAGLAAGVTLLLTLRRQVLSEWAQRFAESDALEQRTTTLYVAAAEQLGSDKAAVRLAGLYALERLGQDNPKLRQTVVDVWCAYLRMPYTPPADVVRRNVEALPQYIDVEAEPQDQTADAERRQELEVRLTAQRLLGSHLSIGLDRAGLSGYWFTNAGNRLIVDLVGATLVDMNLADCAIGSANFSKARFYDGVNLRETQFYGDVNFSNVQFIGDAHMGAVQFHRDAQLSNARFFGVADLSHSRFHGDAYLQDVEFHDGAGFTETEFHGNAALDGTQFHEETYINALQFHRVAYMARMQFHGDADASELRFHGTAHLNEIQFHQGVTLTQTQFYGRVSLAGASFSREADFGNMHFHAGADLSRVQFQSVNLRETQFDGDVKLCEALFHGETNLREASFHGGIDMTGTLALSIASLPPGWALSPLTQPDAVLRLVVRVDGGPSKAD